MPLPYKTTRLNSISDMNAGRKHVETGGLHRVGFRSGCESANDRADQPPGRAAQRVGSAINHMLQNVNKPLRISALSAIAGLSDSYFFSLFKSATGSSPIAYFIRLRMRLACELLQNQGLSIKEVAAEVGYKDSAYFSRVFKLVTGVSPGNYRNVILHPPQKKLDSSPDKPGKQMAGYLTSS